jgi:hypothetical protein
MAAPAAAVAHRLEAVAEVAWAAARLAPAVSPEGLAVVARVVPLVRPGAAARAIKSQRRRAAPNFQARAGATQ